MEARFHHLAWLFGMALVGAAACSQGAGADKEGAPGGGKGGPPGGPGAGPQAGECVGPTWFGAIDDAKRSKVIDLVCADARIGTAPTARLMGDAGPSCKGAFTVHSDEEISAIVAAVDDGLTHEGTLGEASATSSGAKDLARIIRAAHARAGEEDKAMLKRRHLRVQEDPVSHALAKGFDDTQNDLRNAKGAAFDRELVSRTIVQEARAVELYDALVQQAKGDELHCALEKDRDLALAHLALACEALDGLPPPQSTLVRPTRAPVLPLLPVPVVPPSTPPAVVEPPPSPPAIVQPPPTPPAVVEPAPTPPAVVEPAPTPPAVVEPPPVLAEHGPAPLVPSVAPSTPAPTEPAPVPDPCEPCP